MIATRLWPVAALLAVTALPALAGRRAECRRACGQRVFRCVTATIPFGPIGKGCARAVWKNCVKYGVQSCMETTTTTSTSTTSSTTLDAGDVTLLATGQTWCADSIGAAVPCAGTGQDGELQTGLTHAYVDNGDGTITDLRTHLMWEKLSDDGGIHDKDDAYSPWESAFGSKVATLNAIAFAGHADWRLPNRNELESLVDIGPPLLAIAPVFDNGACQGQPVPSATGCTILECSCTVTGQYWSSSSYQKAGVMTYAWAVSFLDGQVFASWKGDGGFVRAVRDAAAPGWGCAAERR